MLRKVFILKVSFAVICVPVIAQENISKADVQNELLRASLSNNSQNSAKELSESDLEKAEKKLLAAEARLLERAGQEGAIDPKLPHSQQNSEISIREKDIQPLSSPEHNNEVKPSLDLNRVIAAIDKTKKDPSSTQAASVNIKTQRERAELEADHDLAEKNAALEKELHEAKSRINDLLSELDTTRNRLMIAETQVERLSSIIDSSSTQSRNSAGTATTSNTDARAAGSMARSNPAQQRHSVNAPSSSPDMQIAVVIADKVHLRTGPGKENSPLMAVTKGTRLAVETKNGGWYRVIAPTGARAWVSEETISFSTADKLQAASRGNVLGSN